jgi:hypothetical protein
MRSREDITTDLVQTGMTMDFMRLLGWQGGTVHQVSDELIRRGLRTLAVEEAYYALRRQIWQEKKQKERVNGKT